ncbi:MAG TPA: DUF6134 family protein [Ramlibacter sp.]|nr:DUF6134 family protein [Ramlibacter sp.]
MSGSRAFALVACLAAPAAHAQVWDFEVRLDGRPIGTHRFVLSGPAAARQVESTARFDVTLLGIPLYRYRHEARERWRGDCLVELQSRTDDDGKPVQVDQRREDPGCGTATSAAGARQVLVLWLERGSGRWIGLDGQVQGGRLLTCRLP